MNFKHIRESGMKNEVVDIPKKRMFDADDYKGGLDMRHEIELRKLVEEVSAQFRASSPGHPPYMILNLVEEGLNPVLPDVIPIRKLVQLALSACYLSGRYDFPVLIGSNNDSDCIELNFQSPWDGSGTPSPMTTSLSQELRWVFLQPRRDVQRDLTIMLLKKFAQAYGIRVSVSRSKETGFAINCTLPWNSPSLQGYREKPLVLLVEDMKPHYLLMSMYLNKCGIDTVWASHGQSGLEMAQDIKPDMIVLNINMPVMDGWECLQKLKADPGTRVIPVIMCSVLRNVELSLKLGAVDHIVKPVIREDFIHRICQFLTPQRSLVQRPVEVTGNLCLLSVRDAWNMRTKKACRAERVITIDAASDFALDHVLHIQAPLDAFVVDMEQDCDQLFPLVMMIRLCSHLEHVPIIAVTSEISRSDAEFWYVGLVDKFTDTQTLLDEVARRQLYADNMAH